MAIINVAGILRSRYLMELTYLGRNGIEERGREGRTVGLGPGDGREERGLSRPLSLSNI